MGRNAVRTENLKFFKIYELDTQHWSTVKSSDALMSVQSILTPRLLTSFIKLCDFFEPFPRLPRIKAKTAFFGPCGMVWVPVERYGMIRDA